MHKTFQIPRFISNFFFVLGISIANAVAVFLFTTYAAQQLDKGTFGKFSTVQILVTSFFILTEWGLTSVVVREVAQKREQASYIAGNFLALKLVVGFLATISLVLLTSILGYDSDTQRLILIYSFFLIAYSIKNACVAIFNGHEQMGYTSIVNASGIFGYALGGIILALGFKLEAVFLVIVGSAFLGSGVGLLILYSRFGVRNFMIFDLKQWRSLFIVALPFAVVELLTLLGVAIGPIILSRTAGEMSVGYFYIANNIINVFMLIVAAYNAVVFPFFGRLQVSAQESLQLGYRISIKIVLIFGGGIVSILTVAASNLVNVIFPGYSQAIPAIQILAWYAYFAMLATPSFNVLYAERRQSEVARIVIIATTVAVGLSVLLIPLIGITGVCIALVSFTFLESALSFAIVSKRFPMGIKRTILKAVFTSAITVSIGVILRATHPIASLLIMGIVLIIAVLSLNILDPVEWNILSGLPFINRLSSSKLVNPTNHRSFK